MSTANNPQHKEGKVAKSIENQTAKIPSDVFLWAALGSIAVSLTLKFMGKKRQHDALFVGQWAAPFLLLGVYNKLVKLQGSDKSDKPANEDRSIPGVDHLATSPIVSVENEEQ